MWTGLDRLSRTVSRITELEFFSLINLHFTLGFSLRRLYLMFQLFQPQTHSCCISVDRKIANLREMHCQKLLVHMSL